jgi:hypothetical protein
MNIPHSDPLVFFCAIGDLAHKPLLNCISPTFQLRIRGLCFHRKKYPSGHWNSHKKPKKDEALLSERPFLSKGQILASIQSTQRRSSSSSSIALMMLGPRV